MEPKSIPKITKSNVVVEMFISKNLCQIILKPMKQNITPSPYFKFVIDTTEQKEQRP